MELSRRMSAVAALVPKNTVVCDIGCDHGFVSIYLVKHNICPKVIAMDINEGPLERAREHILNAHLGESIETRLSDGAAKLEKGEADGMIIAGMGGRLVVKILEESIEKVREMSYLVLQPQSELAFVRAFLRKQKFQVLMEDMVYEDGKYYPMILVNIHSQDQMFYEELIDRAAQEELLGNLDADKITILGDQFGPCLLLEAHPVLEDYLLCWERCQKEILDQVSEHPQRKEEVEEELERISLARKLMMM